MGISVLMAIYKNDDVNWLRLCLESINKQTVQPEEVVIVMDGQLDDRQKLLIDNHRFHGEKIITGYKDNMGLGYALNHGLKLCSQEYVARFDADDVSLPTRLLKQSEFLNNNLDVDVVGASLIEIDEHGAEGRQIDYPETHEDCLKMFMKRDPVAHPAVMFRKKVIVSAGSYSFARKDQDTELWGRVFKIGGKFANLQLPLVFFRRTSDFFIKRSSFDRVKAFFRIKSKINKELKLGYKSQVFLISYCIMMLCPAFLKRFFYNFR